MSATKQSQQTQPPRNATAALPGERAMQGVFGWLLASIAPSSPSRARTPEPAQPAAAASKAPAPPICWTTRLWGGGFELPGGAEEVRRLAALLPLDHDRRLLLGGRGMLGAATTITEDRRCPISVLHTPGQPPPAALKELIAAQRDRVTLDRWDPEAPRFPRRHHHALLIEPGHLGAAPGPLLAATAAGLYQSAELVMVDLVAGARKPPGEVSDRWLSLEGRRAPRPEGEFMAALAKAGFRVNVTEDLAERHAAAVRQAWARIVASVLEARPRPPKADLLRMVDEVERWLLRLKLIEDGSLRMLRWHASLRS
jgi:hypothetical protein